MAIAQKLLKIFFKKITCLLNSNLIDRHARNVQVFQAGVLNFHLISQYKRNGDYRSSCSTNRW